MKILITSSIRFALNGVTNVIMNYYRNITSEKIQFDFVVINELDTKTKEEIINRGGTVHYLPMRNNNPVQYIKELTKICKAGNYDIIHSHGNSRTLAFEMYSAKKGNVKIRIAHSHATNCKHKIINWILSPIFFGTYTHGFACSEPAGIWLFGKKKYNVVNNAFDIEKFKFNNEVRIKYREDLNIEGSIVIGHVGGFNDSKNHHHLIDVFNEYQLINPCSVLLLIGEGKNKNEMINNVSRLGLSNKVLFLGARDDVEMILNAFDVFVFPSKYEGLGIVLLEAQANGLPVFASNAVPEKAKVLVNFQFISLNEGPRKWAESIENNEKIRYIEGYKVIRDSGYDISLEAKKLETMYYELVHKDKH